MSAGGLTGAVVRRALEEDLRDLAGIVDDGCLGAGIRGVGCGTLWADEPSAPPTPEDLRAFADLAPRGAPLRLVVDRLETARDGLGLAAAAAPWTGVLGVPVLEDARLAPGTLALLDRCGVPVAVVQVSAPRGTA